MNKARLAQLNADDRKVVIQRVEAAEVDEIWSYVGKKTAPRWLWHAIDHYSGAVLAYAFGRRQDAVVRELQQLLPPFGTARFYTDHGGAYARQLKAARYFPGKRQIQRIERKHLMLRTRINRVVRKTICFSRSVQMHEIGTGLFINRLEFGVQI